MWSWILKILKRNEKTPPARRLNAGNYIFYNLIYQGMWTGFYTSEKPDVSYFDGEVCSYRLSMPKALSSHSTQTKYFYQGICAHDNYPHTIIFEYNISKSGEKWWTYGAKILPERHFRLMRVSITTTPRIWLDRTSGWNRHCDYWLGYDACYYQHFVTKIGTVIKSK